MNLAKQMDNVDRILDRLHDRFRDNRTWACEYCYFCKQIATAITVFVKNPHDVLITVIVPTCKQCNHRTPEALPAPSPSAIPNSRWAFWAFKDGETSWGTTWQPGNEEEL